MSTPVGSHEGRRHLTAAGWQRAELRRTNFLYQDGVMLCATLRALDELAILERSLAADAAFTGLSPDVSIEGFGYLRAGLRCLAAQGWLDADPTLDPETTVPRWTTTGRKIARHRSRYVALGRFLASFSSSDPDAWERAWTDDQATAFEALVDAASERWALDLEPDLLGTVRTHLDAALIVPTILWLTGSGRLGDDGPALPDGAGGPAMGRLLTVLGWIDADRRWTDHGRQMLPFTEHFGLVGSYLPLLARLPQLYRGEVSVAQSLADGSQEWHCHRELNVIASSAAHGRYFADADEVFVEIFNREPIDAQPRFVADVGSGEGSWLVHLHRVIRERTLRGKHLDTHPLVMVGVDYNDAALDRTRRSLLAAGVPGLPLVGDVTDPDGLRDALARHGLAIEDGLHIRSFLDHDRNYRGGDSDVATIGSASGAYVDGRGQPLDGAAVERDLVAHLRRWTPHVRRHGLVVLEAHCVPSRVTSKNIGALHSVAFDTYHAYSHQYPIDHSAFMRCCRQAGLEPASRSQRRYPSSRPFVAVSLNRFVASGARTVLPALRSDASRQDTWRPEPGGDLADGRALHEFLYTDGDLRHPRPWCSAPTGYVVAGALAAIEERLAQANAGDVLRVLDYGTGTGLAAIELLKACQEAGVPERLAARGATLELHLADLPGSWFAQGHALLRDCEWTRFHSLRDAAGRFRRLLEVTGGRRMDVVMASMVFHLIPHSALERTTVELARITKPGGRLIWNSPDLGPAGPHAVLFHDPNRALRRLWLSRANGRFDADLVRAGQARADRRILPRAHSADDVADVLSRRFNGYAESQTHEMLDADFVDAILVPSNQSEYFPELHDGSERASVIRDLMLGDVLPSMQQGEAGTGGGLNVQWTLGNFSRRPGRR